MEVKLGAYDGYTPVTECPYMDKRYITSYGSNKFDKFYNDSGSYAQVGKVFYLTAYAKFGVIGSGYDNIRSDTIALLTKNSKDMPVVFIRERYRNFKVIKEMVKYLKSNHNLTNKNFKYASNTYFDKFFFRVTIPARVIAYPTSLITELINNETNKIQLGSSESVEQVSELVSI